MDALEEAKKLMDEIQDSKIQKVEEVVPEVNLKVEYGKMTKNPNPYGANKTNRDPREKKCWEYYLKTIAKGSPNGAESARKAGYSESSAREITSYPWFKKRLANLRRKEMVDKAEEVLNEILNLPNETEITLEGVPTGLKKIDVGIIGHKKDVAKFVAERLISDKYAQKQKVEQKLTHAVLIAELNDIFK